MKKALLLMLGAITSYSGFAQIDTFYNSSKGLSTSLVDTLQLTTYNPQHGSGYSAGMNDGDDGSGANPAMQVMGAAEAYTPTYDATKSYKIIGMVSVWSGSMNTVGAETLTYKVWSVNDTHAGAYPVTGSDSIAGFPGTVLTSTPDNFAHISANLNNAHGPLLKGSVKKTFTAFATAAEVNTPFFVGFTFDNTYTFGTPADTIGVAEIQTPAGSFAPYPGHDDYFINEGTYKLYQSRNCVLSNGAWIDLYWQYGLPEFLAMYPIVELDALSVGGVTKGGLTFSGTYPNPAVNNTNIKFSLTKNADVTVEIMDMSGRVLNTIQQKSLGNGEHTIQVSTANMAAGNYLYSVTTSNGDAIGSKLTVIK